MRSEEKGWERELFSPPDATLLDGDDEKSNDLVAQSDAISYPALAPATPHTSSSPPPSHFNF
jgi:hypothetical protein